MKKAKMVRASIGGKVLGIALILIGASGLFGAYVQNIINQYSIPAINAVPGVSAVPHSFVVSALSELKMVVSIIGNLLVLIIGILYYKGIISFDFGLRFEAGG